MIQCKNTLWLFLTVFAILLLSNVPDGNAQIETSGLVAAEPDTERYDAPVYPGATFIRTMEALDGVHETAMYVTEDEKDDVEDFFDDFLSGIQKVYYTYNRQNNIAWILDENADFPNNPSERQIVRIDEIHHVHIKENIKIEHQYMIDYYRRKPDHVHKAEAMEKGQTLIYYTFARPPEGFEIYEDIIGVWKNTDRDLPVYINSIMTFGEDNSWTHELTPENVDFMVNAIKNVEQFQDMTEAERREYVESRNPQTGSYHFIFDALVIEYDNAIGGRKGITGQASVKSIVLTIRFDTPKNMEEQGKLYPDLHFIRVDDTPE